jgi:hypothetical protein
MVRQGARRDGSEHLLRQRAARGAFMLHTPDERLHALETGRPAEREFFSHGENALRVLPRKRSAPSPTFQGRMINDARSVRCCSCAEAAFESAGGVDPGSLIRTSRSTDSCRRMRAMTPIFLVVSEFGSQEARKRGQREERLRWQCLGFLDSWLPNSNQDTAIFLDGFSGQFITGKSAASSSDTAVAPILTLTLRTLLFHHSEVSQTGCGWSCEGGFSGSRMAELAPYSR